MSAFTYHNMYEHELQALLKEEIERLKEILAAGLLENHFEYKHTAGRIGGLRTALEFMDEAARICNHKAR